MTDLEHEKVFQQAWLDPSTTRFELTPVDVNKVLAQKYVLGEPLVFTRAMLWDMEVRKARQPDLFIPYVVKSGSAATWGGDDVFVRESQQRLWLARNTYGRIIEQTNLDHVRQIVTFIGAAEHAGPAGELLRATTDQVVFHVEHSVGGTENQPLNRWRIVHRTAGPDARLIAVFTRIDADPWLPEHTEIYIRDILGIALTRR
jgi:hypothetical protein